jgi:hypothetical protein
MNDFFERAIETLEILVEALRPHLTFDKKSVYKLPKHKGNYAICDKRFNRNISPAFHRKILQRS